MQKNARKHNKNKTENLIVKLGMMIRNEMFYQNGTCFYR